MVDSYFCQNKFYGPSGRPPIITTCLSDLFRTGCHLPGLRYCHACTRRGSPNLREVQCVNHGPIRPQNLDSGKSNTADVATSVVRCKAHPNSRWDKSDQFLPMWTVPDVRNNLTRVWPKLSVKLKDNTWVQEHRILSKELDGVQDKHRVIYNCNHIKTIL